MVSKFPHTIFSQNIPKQSLKLWSIITYTAIGIGSITNNDGIPLSHQIRTTQSNFFDIT